MKIEIRCEGYLGRDFEIRQSNRSNNVFATSVLGVSGVISNGNQPLSNNDNNFNENSPETAWFDLVMFGDQVQQTYQYFLKGMRVEIVGTLTFSTFTDRNNQQRESKRVVVREIRHVCHPQLGPELLNLARQSSANRQQNSGNFNNNNRFNNQNSFSNNNNQNSFGSNNQGGFGSNANSFGSGSNQDGFGSNTNSFGSGSNQGGFGSNANSFSSGNQGGFGSNTNSFGGGFGSANDGSVNSFAKNNNSGFGSSSFPSANDTKKDSTTETTTDDTDDIPF